MGELGLSWKGMFSPGTHRRLSRKIIKPLRARSECLKDHVDVDGEWEAAVFFFFWNANVEQSSCLDF